MNNYTIIPAMALCIYVFLFLSFMAAKKTKVIYGFMLVLLAFIAWTGGSLLMRMEMWPNYEVWYHVSIFGLVFLPFCFYYFIHFLTDNQDSRFLYIWFLLSLANGVINMVFDLFVPCPTLIVMENGQTAFVYDKIGWPVIILFVTVGIVVVHMFTHMIRYSRENMRAKEQMKPIFVGIGILFLGHILLMIPVFSGFPIDVLSGVANAFCMFYAMYKSKLFRLTLLVSRGTCYAVVVVLTILLFSTMDRPISVWMQNGLGIPQMHATFIVSGIFIVIAIWLYSIIYKYVDNVFIKDETMQADNLKDFALAVSKSLYVEDIVEELVHVIEAALPVHRVYVFIRDTKEDIYAMMRSNRPMEHALFKIKADNPAVTWLETNDQTLLWKDFLKHSDYETMRENEKIMLNGMDIGYLVPLKDADDLIGIVMLSGKDKADNLGTSDMLFLDSIESIASIAIKNSRLYEKAYYEARTDELTGLLNRKYFYLTLEEQIDKCSDSSLALMILNVDDFKLYNRLYGNKEGDEALIRIAAIIKDSIGKNGYVARYSGKEFAVILPSYDAFSAKKLAEAIRLRILNMNKNKSEFDLRVITVSGGICTIPQSANSAKELIEYADMAVYNAKRKGKNNILVYDIDANRSEMAVKPNAVFKEGIYSTYENTIMALTAAIDAKDHYTFDHSQNVAYYATELAKEYGLNHEMVEIIREAALLHDIGKIGISENILNKKGKLTDEEFEIIKGHVEQSISIIRHLPSLDYVIPAVIGHHERYDGKGYPRRIGGEDIPLSARILCIADSFDAMVSARSYKKAYTMEYAISELEKNAGTQFDPDLSHIFVKLLREEKVTIRTNHMKKEDLVS